MNCREVKYYLDDFAEGRLIDEMRNEIENHLDSCLKCQGEYIDLNLILSEVKSSPKTIDPSKDLLERINERISGRSGKRKRFAKIFSLLSHESDSYDFDSDEIRKKNSEKNKARLIFVGGTAATILLGVLLGILYFHQSSVGFIPVESLSGTPRIGSEQLKNQSVLQIGEWLQTNENSSARLIVGMIGEVDVHPKSRVKLIKTTSSEYRLSLNQGKIEASIWAPPRKFYIETPSATAIDLGGIYTLEVDKDGSGQIKVTSGWVALESTGIESLIPADAVCTTKKHFAPGTPYFEDAPAELIQALEEFDFTPKAFGESFSKNIQSQALNVILKQARKKDALSLWHILSRVDGENRAKTYFKLTELVMTPKSVTFEGIMNGDSAMLEEWWELLGYGSSSVWNN